MAVRADEATAAEKFSTTPTDNVVNPTRPEQALALGELVEVAAAGVFERRQPRRSERSSCGTPAGAPPAGSLPRTNPAARRHRRDHALVRDATATAIAALLAKSSADERNVTPIGVRPTNV